MKGKGASKRGQKMTSNNDKNSLPKRARKTLEIDLIINPDAAASVVDERPEPSFDTKYQINISVNVALSQSVDGASLAQEKISTSSQEVKEEVPFSARPRDFTSQLSKLNVTNPSAGVALSQNVAGPSLAQMAQSTPLTPTKGKFTFSFNGPPSNQQSPGPSSLVRDVAATQQNKPHTSSNLPLAPTPKPIVTLSQILAAAKARGTSSYIQTSGIDASNRKIVERDPNNPAKYIVRSPKPQSSASSYSSSQLIARLNRIPQVVKLREWKKTPPRAKTPSSDREFQSSPTLSTESSDSDEADIVRCQICNMDLPYLFLTKHQRIAHGIRNASNRRFERREIDESEEEFETSDIGPLSMVEAEAVYSDSNPEAEGQSSRTCGTTRIWRNNGTSELNPSTSIETIEVDSSPEAVRPSPVNMGTRSLVDNIMGNRREKLIAVLRKIGG